MTRYPEIDAVLAGERQWCVLHADALDVLPTVDLSRFAAAIVDPPYGIAHSSNHGASWQGTQIDGDANTATRDAILALLATVPMAVFGTWKVQCPPQTRVSLVWDKGPAFGMGDLSLPWKSSWEEIYIMGKGWAGHRDEGVLRGHMVVSWESHGRLHPHEKPVSLIKYLLEKMPRGGAILDPCCGSGSVGVACRALGRPYVGMDVDDEWAETARRRIASTPAPLFPAESTPPKQLTLGGQHE